MNEVIRTLEDIGVSSIMSDATQKNYSGVADLILEIISKVNRQKI